MLFKNESRYYYKLHVLFTLKYIVKAEVIFSSVSFQCHPNVPYWVVYRCMRAHRHVYHNQCIDALFTLSCPHRK